MLINLQPLDIDPSHRKPQGRQDDHHPHPSLRGKVPAKSTLRDDQGAGAAEDCERNHDVAIQSVEEEGFVADNGDELEADEEGGGEDGVEVKFHA